MADIEKVLHTRIKLKFDKKSAWETNNPILKAGEMGIFYEGEIDKSPDSKGPSISGKIGDGVHHFNDLQPITGLAGDVSAWAKAPNKPDYKASEIQGLEDYISGKVQDTNTKYKLVKVDGSNFNYKLQMKEINGAWIDVSEGDGITIPEFDPTEINKKIDDHIANTSNPHGVTAAQVGLGKVENKSVEDIKTELTGKVEAGNLGFAKGGDVHTAVEGAKTSSAITVTESTPEGWAKSYTFTQNGTTVGTINLPKELVIQSGTVEEVTDDGKPYSEAKIGDKYIDLVIQNQSEHIYIPAKDLVDIYTAKSNATQIQVNISNTNEISATIVAKSVTETELSDGVNTKLEKINTNETSIGNINKKLSTLEGTTNTALQSISINGTAFTKSGTAATMDLVTAQTALGLNSYLKEIKTTKDNGLKVTNKNRIDIDTGVVFVLDGGTSSGWL